MEVKLSFIPAELHLNTGPDGQFKVTLQGAEIFRSSSGTKALKKFNEVKRELEERFPTHEFSVEDKREILLRELGDHLVAHNSVRPVKRKSSARNTRTFG